MKSKLLLCLVVFLVLNCKPKPDATKSKAVEAVVKPKTTSWESPMIKELLEFVDLELKDTTAMSTYFLFKEIDRTKKEVVEIDIERALTLYKKLMQRGESTSFPIFELQDTNMAILPIQGVGFGGALWARVLVDKTTLEIKKIAFEHKAESDGYGAGISKSAFEEQFVGGKVDLDADTFVLRQAMEKINDDGHAIDGISGATVTSAGVIQMVNEGMKNYRNYLRP